METKDEKIDEIRKRLVSEPALSISRIPEKTRKEFIKLANDEFCSDRGMTLKFLLDNYQGLITTGVEHIEIELSVQRERQNGFEKRLSGLEQQKEEKPKKKRLG